MTIREGLLVLADGSVFEGELIGAHAPGGVATGEVVFNTALSGYQEIITDPSYAGQIITFTYPHIGNYGVAAVDSESRSAPSAAASIVRDLARRHSNFRAEDHLGALLAAHAIPGIAGIDTRRLTRLIRDVGAMPGAFGDAEPRRAGRRRRDRARHRRRRPRRPGHDRRALHASATVPRQIVAYDFGIKTTILRQLSRLGRVEVVPATDQRRRRARPPARRRVPLERPGRPGRWRSTRPTRSPS